MDPFGTARGGCLDCHCYGFFWRPGLEEKEESDQARRQGMGQNSTTRGPPGDHASPAKEVGGNQMGVGQYEILVHVSISHTKRFWVPIVDNHSHITG